MHSTDDSSTSSGDNIPLAPAGSERKRLVPATGLAAPPGPAVVDDSQEQRFSLRALLVTMTVATIVLAIGRLMSPQWFAFLCGMAALGTLIVTALLGIRSATAQWFFWTFMAIYAVAAWAIHGTMR